MKVAELPVPERQFPVDQAKLAPGKYTFYVKAVGKPSLMNHVSNGVAGEIGVAH
jgi:hypothetical protein